MKNRGLEYADEKFTARRMYQEYLRRIDVEAVLNHYGARNMSHDGDEILHSCLLNNVDPHHGNGDENPSALANVKEKLYLCRTYSDWRGGDILQFIMRMEQTEEFHKVVPVIAEMLGDAVAPKAEFKDILKKKLFPETKSDEPMTTYNDRVLRGWAQYHPYLVDRGISLEAASRLQIGYDKVARRITFPHWTPDGALVGWQKRRLDADPRWPKTPPEPVLDDDKNIVGYRDPPPKYKNSSGFPKLTTLYNLNRVLDRGKTDVIVVESPMSVAMAETLMLDTSDRLAGVVATFGASMPDEQIALLRQFRKVYIYMDSDAAGSGSTRRMLQGLYRHTTTYQVQPETDKDLGDYRDRDDVMAVIEGRVRPAFAALAAFERERRDRESTRKARDPVPRGRT